MDERDNHHRTRCTATCADGSRCRAWAVRGTEPPRCAPHGGGQAPVGAPQGNQNARTHGFYARAELAPNEPSPEDWTIDTLIADYATRHFSLSRYVGRLLAEDNVDHRELSRLLTLYGKSASRLRRLFEERHIQQQASERLRAVIARALQRSAADPEIDP